MDYNIRNYDADAILKSTERGANKMGKVADANLISLSYRGICRT